MPFPNLDVAMKFAVSEFDTGVALSVVADDNNAPPSLADGTEFLAGSYTGANRNVARVLTAYTKFEFDLGYEIVPIMSGNSANGHARPANLKWTR